MKLNGATSGVFLLPFLLTACAVRAQTPTYDSSADNAFSAPCAAVAAGQTLADGWTDLAGGVYSVSDGSLQATNANPSGYLTDLALRPSGEEAATPNVRGTIYVPNGFPTPDTVNGIVLRYQPDGTFYLFQLSSNTLFAYKISGGAEVTRLGALDVSPVTGDPYTLTGSAVNAPSGVALAVSAMDTRTGKSIGTLDVTDASSPITLAGRAGVDSWVGNGAADTMTASYSRVVFTQLPASPRPVPAPPASPKIGFIGDSITAGYNQVGSTITPGTNDVATLTVRDLSKVKGMTHVDSGIAWSAYDQGSSGSSTADWQPGTPDGLEGRAKSAFTAAFGQPNPKTNPVWVFVMLGTNDVRSDHRFTARQHQENLEKITQDLVDGGYNVVINRAPAFVTPTSFNGVTWDAAGLALLNSYLPGERAVVASFAHPTPGRVFLGDTAAFDYFAAHPPLFQEYGVYGGLHPNGNGGTQALASFWARAFLRIKK